MKKDYSEKYDCINDKWDKWEKPICRRCIHYVSGGKYSTKKDPMYIILCNLREDKQTMPKKKTITLMIELIETFKKFIRSYEIDHEKDMFPVWDEKKEDILRELCEIYLGDIGNSEKVSNKIQYILNDVVDKVIKEMKGLKK